MAFVNLPPNLKDMFYNLSDRISKLETGPNQAMYTAESAQTTAADAQVTADNAYTDAVAAAAAAAAASAVAATAVQVSANTIVNASNQMTAINTNGISVYSNSLSSGARVIMNSAGLAGYNSSNNATFSIESSTGNVSVTGGILSGGSITGTTINVPTAGSPAFSVNALGAVTCTNITINGGQIYLNGGVFSVSSAGVVNATSGTIGGWSLSSTKLYSGTSEINATTGNAVFNGVTGFGQIYGYSSLYITTTGYFGGTLEAAGSVTMGSGTANPFYYLSSSGTLRSLYTYGKAVTGRAMQINSAGDFGTTASTLRKKHDVQPYAIDTSKLLQLNVKTFKYLPEIDEQQEQQYGFIAEEAEALNLLPLVLYNEEGQVDYFAYEKLPIFLLQLAQEQEARIKALEGN